MYTYRYPSMYLCIYVSIAPCIYFNRHRYMDTNIPHDDHHLLLHWGARIKCERREYYFRGRPHFAAGADTLGLKLHRGGHVPGT